jgi:hypothetical protein
VLPANRWRPGGVSGTAHRPQKKCALIEAVLEDFGSAADWQTLRDALPPLVADHEIGLVRVGW